MNLTQKQFNWLLKVSTNDGDTVTVMGNNIPWDLRKRATELLKSCGYIKEYDSNERILLLELRDDYIKWKQISDKEDDLPF
mgnify:CR=1 FL=1|jgi:hypothetical protein